MTGVQTCALPILVALDAVSCYTVLCVSFAEGEDSGSAIAVNITDATKQIGRASCRERV